MDEEMDFEVLLPKKVPPKKDVDFEVSISMGERPHSAPHQNVIHPQPQAPYNAQQQNVAYPQTPAHQNTQQQNAAYPQNQAHQNAHPQNVVYPQSQAPQNVQQQYIPPQNVVYPEDPVQQSTQPQDIHSEKFALTKLEQTYVSVAAANQSIQPKETYVNIAVTKDTSQKENYVNTGSQFPVNQSSALSLVEFALILWKGKYIIAACVFLATVIGIMYARSCPDVFSSTSYFVLNAPGSGVEGLARFNMPFGGSSGGGNSDPSDYLDKVIQDGNFLSTLYARKWFFNGDSLALEKILEIEPDQTAHNWEHAYLMRKYNAIRGGKIISTYKEPKTGVIHLRTNTPSPHLAYDLNMHVLDYISSYMRGSIQGRAKEKRAFIDERVREAKTDLDRAEFSLARFRERNMMSASPTIMREEARLIRQINVNQDIYIQLLKQLDIAKVEELDNMQLLQIVKHPEISYTKTSPQTKKIILGAFFIGLLIGSVSVLVMHQFKQLGKLRA